MSALEPTGLMVNLLAHPERTTITTPAPRFSWIVNTSHANAVQHGAQILVASSRETVARDVGDIWDSGEPEIRGAWQTDSRSVAVPYAGEPLRPHTKYWWKVRVWLSANDVSPWSEAQHFVTGALTDRFNVDHYTPEVRSISPARFVRLGDPAAPRYFVDFGRAAFGTIRITLETPEPASVTVHLGEVASGDFSIDRSPGGSRRYRAATLTTAPGRATYQLEIPPDARNTKPFAVAMPEELFEVMPFRYCEVEGAPATLDPGCIEQLVVHYPFDDEAAAFTSSSGVLNDVWHFCRYSIKATSFLGIYVDGDRERIPYESDGYITQLGHFASDREYTMSRRTLDYLVFRPTWPTEWHLYLVLAAWNDYLFTGDDRFIAARYDDLVAKCLIALARDDGLISAERMTDAVLESIHFAGASHEQFSFGVKDVVDWPQVERDGHEIMPINSVVNALYFRALRCLARIASALGKSADARSFSDRADRVRDAFHSVLIDPGTRLVIDGEGSSHSSLHANMFALASGILAGEQVPSVADYVRSRGMACSVYASQMLLESLYASDLGDHALSLLAGTGLRSWAHMIYDVGSTVSLEAWDDSIKPNQDWNHAWGAAPANIVPFGLMGVRPLDPGWATALIDPRPGSLGWAEVRVPTIRGPIAVRVTNTGGIFSVEVTVPSNMTVTVGVPARVRGNAELVVDGRTVAARVEGSRTYVEGIGGGRHSVVTA